MLLSCVRPRRIEFTTENNKRILRPRTNIAPDTNYQLNPCFVSNLILPNPKFYCINNKFYDHGAARAQKAREQKIIWRLLKWHSTPSPAPVSPAGRLGLRADVIKNGAELRPFEPTVENGQVVQMARRGHEMAARLSCRLHRLRRRTLHTQLYPHQNPYDVK